MNVRYSDNMSMIEEKIKSLNEMRRLRQNFRRQEKKVVFTNGVFDILHRGHVAYLEEAGKLGDLLVLGLNSDASVRKIKGNSRPIVPQEDRAFVAAALQCVDYVCLFDEETPAALISALVPDILVKGGDYQIEEIVGRETVWENGGRVVTIPLVPGRSSTDIIGKIVKLVKEGQINA